jgi:hypothetical protein
MTLVTVDLPALVVTVSTLVLVTLVTAAAGDFVDDGFFAGFLDLAMVELPLTEPQG